MLYNMYVSHVTCVDWNGVRSSVFSVINGVKQGGIISTILFCIYIDDLLSGLANLGAGCYLFIYLFIMNIVHKVQTKIKTKGRKTKANPYGSSLHAAQ